MKKIEQWIAAELPNLRRYARALVRDRTAADDLVQDCLERALGRTALWRHGSDIRAWLFSIMHNLYVDQLRRAGRTPYVGSLDEEVENRLSDAVSQAPHDPLLLDHLEKAIDHLPPDQREVLLLVALEGLSYAQVAQVLGIPEGTVMSRLSRARNRLRTLLAGEQRPIMRRVK